MLKIFSAVAAFILIAASFVSANPIPVRGVVEGFYGQPWSHRQRLDIIQFCADHQFNAYIYAPKDDPYHRAQWRDSYPALEIERLRELIAVANQNRVDFIFAVSPGLDLNYSDDDLNAMLDNLSAIHALGCRRFAVFFDDIEDHDGAAQADFLNRINQQFVKTHSDIKPLITVPTQYFRLDMLDENGNVKPYTKDFSSTLDPDILVLYTGDRVVLPELNDQQLQDADRIYGRELGIWWNYPVNDYMPQKLALGPVENLPSNAPAIFFNPMSAFELSKITLATAADYSLDPQHYDPQSSWLNALNNQFGSLSNEMRLFALHSQHLKNNWADVGRPDDPILRAEFQRLLNGEDRCTVVNEKLIEIDNAVKRLKLELPENILIECRPQLDQLERITDADLLAVELLQCNDQTAAARLKKILLDKAAVIDRSSESALISELCAYDFIIRVLASK